MAVGDEAGELALHHGRAVLRDGDADHALLPLAFAALASLTRPDGLLHVVAYPLVVFTSGAVPIGRPRVALRPIARFAAVALTPLALYVAWRLWTFGRLLPNTGVAKEQGLPGWDAFQRPTELVDYVGWSAFTFAVIVVALGWRTSAAFRSAMAVLAVPLALAIASFAVLAEVADMEERYFECWHRTMEATAANGGGIAHHHGSGRLRIPYLHHDLGAGGVQLLRTLKGAVDPAGIMNPGNLIPPPPL